jgi:hypothetical protein
MKIKRFRDLILRFLSQPRNFSLTAGAILFGMGIIGFAFRSEGSLPDKYLAGALVIGFWGIVSGLWDGGGKYAARRATDKMLNER